MKRLALTLCLALLLLAAASHAGTLEQLETAARANPTSVPARAALAEAYLRECQLEKSLGEWQAIRKLDPNHARAKTVVDRLTAQALDLDTHLDTLAAMVERGIVEGTGALLDAAARRAATTEQKARILFLRGALADEDAEPAQARAGYEAAARLYPHAAWGARAAMALAEAEPVDDARRRLRALVDDDRLQDPAVKELARLRLLLVDTTGMTSQVRTTALRDLIAALATPEAKREALGELADLLTDAQGRWVPDAVDALAASLRTAPQEDAVADILDQLRVILGASGDPTVLDSVLAALNLPDDAPLERERRIVRIEALLARAAVAEQVDEAQQFIRAAHTDIDALAARPDAGSQRRALDLRGRALLLEAQKLVTLDGPTPALPVLTRAKNHYLATLPMDPAASLRRLFHIGRLLEQVREWETACDLYRETAARFPHTLQGRDALLKVAQLCETRLAAPLAALDVYAQYAARYPAELPYRQLDVGQRLERLGYANVLDFQKRNRLEPDGLFGPVCERKLEELERTFDLVSGASFHDGPRAPRVEVVEEDAPEDTEETTRPVHTPGVLRGKFVHQTMYRIARDLDTAGNDHEAVLAYRMFLNLFPTKREADDALIAIARIFARNLLFHEALGAYAELMEDFPKGNMTSEAYVEAARCHENLGQWEDAISLYKLYLKKFPKYHHKALCEARVPLLEEIQQYQDFIATTPNSPKLPEAQYQIATILYKQFKNYTKAAVEYTKVADRHPKHVRAADALFTAGSAQLRAENFPAARVLFAQLVANYADTRLADDGQYWVGHTYEYAARALGRLDDLRVVLRQRSLSARTRLLADLELRRHYHPDAQAGPAVPEDVWGGDTLGVLASGSKRDRVNTDLYRAIRAYEQVVARFKTGDMAGKALLRIGTIYTSYLKDPEKGMAAFQQLLEHHPGSKEAVGALFEVGAYHLEKKNYPQAIDVYSKFVYNYPNDKRVEDAMVAIARCHIETKTWDKALDACRSYLNRFPKGKHAEFVNNQVNWIRMYQF